MKKMRFYPFALVVGMAALLLATSSQQAYADEGDPLPKPPVKKHYQQLPPRQKPRIAYQYDEERTLEVVNGCQVVCFPVYQIVSCQQPTYCMAPNGCWVQSGCQIVQQRVLIGQQCQSIPVQQYRESIQERRQPIFIDADVYEAERQAQEIVSYESYRDGQVPVAPSVQRYSRTEQMLQQQAAQQIQAQQAQAAAFLNSPPSNQAMREEVLRQQALQIELQRQRLELERERLSRGRR